MAYDRNRDDWRGERSGGRAGSIFSDDDDRRGGRGGRDWNPEDYGWGRSSEGGGDRGFFERARDEVRSWFGDEEGDDRRGGGGERRESGGSPGRGQPGRSHFDENYRRWRDRQIAQLDREYEDYCRERQSRFEKDFDSWRQSRPPRATEGGQGAAGEAAGTAQPSSSRSALLGESDAAAETAGGGSAPALEASTGRGGESGSGRGRR